MDESAVRTTFDALSESRWDDARALIAAGIGLDFRFEEYSTLGEVRDCRSVLTEACENNAPPDVVRELVRTRSSLMRANRRGDTPLNRALFHDCDVDLLRILIEAGADVNQPNKDGNAPLHDAVQRRSDAVNVVRLLLDAGADPDVLNSTGHTPLSLAVGFDAEVVRLLLEAKADTNKSSSSGLSPLQRAMMYEAKADVVKLLIAAGADVTNADVGLPLSFSVVD